ncbi:MAG: glycosyltransferase family 4 protein, partial [Psychroserpens sp.]|nr:glycosyltransferase family 4 protein [Psychroserpens sp.]
FSLIWFYLWNKIPKTVIVQSPPLIVAFTSMLFLKSKKRNLILNVSDLWPIAGFELGALKKNFGYRVLEAIEKFNYKRASLVLGQSEEIISHVQKTVPGQRVLLYRNFPDIETKSTAIMAANKPMKLVYAGLLGFAQGILKLCQELNYEHIEFHIYGSGAEQQSLEAFIEEHPELPITYHGQVSRNELHDVLLQYDLTIIPLLNRIYGSVPSKIFEYAKLGLPMIYFGGGEGETLIKTHKLGWVAEAGNYSDLNKVINEIDPEILTSELRQQITDTAEKEFDFKRQLLVLKEVL